MSFAEISTMMFKVNLQPELFLSTVDACDSFSAIFIRDNFCDVLFAFLRNKPFLMKVYSETKEFAPG